MKLYKISSPDIGNLHLAVHYQKWAFNKNDNPSSDKSLFTNLQNINIGDVFLGVHTVKGDDYGALIYGAVRSLPINKLVTDDPWKGTYQYPICIDWSYLYRDKTKLPKSDLNKILGDLRGGHHKLPNGTNGRSWGPRELQEILRTCKVI